MFPVALILCKDIVEVVSVSTTYGSGWGFLFRGTQVPTRYRRWYWLERDLLHPDIDPEVDGHNFNRNVALTVGGVKNGGDEGGNASVNERAEKRRAVARL